ncbi:MAG TPA: hypothetical protein VF256_18400, partial [Streptosporangiaceae bacterium]
MDAPATWSALMGTLVRGEALTSDDTAWAMGEIMEGAAISSPQLGDCLRRQASASSRPPEPNSRMFMDLPDDVPDDKNAGLL